jgi:hypothetical protein
MPPRPSAIKKAEELGATISGGINWDWATGFPSPEVAKEFIAWLDANNYEHRGYYPADKDSGNHNLHSDGVRFR